MLGSGGFGWRLLGSGGIGNWLLCLVVLRCSAGWMGLDV